MLSEMEFDPVYKKQIDDFSKKSEFALFSLYCTTKSAAEYIVKKRVLDEFKAKKEAREARAAIDDGSSDRESEDGSLQVVGSKTTRRW